MVLHSKSGIKYLKSLVAVVFIALALGYLSLAAEHNHTLLGEHQHSYDCSGCNQLNNTAAPAFTSFGAVFVLGGIFVIAPRHRFFIVRRRDDAHSPRAPPHIS